jgi:molybdate transport system regulatory protein
VADVPPKIRLLIGEAVALGPGKAKLLETIGTEGSIRKAAKRLGMSYRRAWLLVDAMNADFAGPLVERSRGGAGGGGATLTPLGENALARYRALEDKAAKALKEDLADFQKLLKTPK